MLSMNPKDSELLVTEVIDKFGHLNPSHHVACQIQCHLMAHMPLEYISYNAGEFRNDTEQFANVIMALQYPQWDTSNYDEETMAMVTIARAHVAKIAPEYLTPGTSN